MSAAQHSGAGPQAAGPRGAGGPGGAGPDFWGAVRKASERQGGRGSIPRMPRNGRLALSSAQNRLWLLDQMEPGGVGYNVPVAWQAEGDLDTGALARSLNAVSERHEILRTVFPEIGGHPVAEVRPELRIELSVEDVRPDADASRRATEFLRRPFDLARGPLARAAAFRTAARRWLFLFAVHQIVFDGGSMRVLGNELGEFYRSFVEGRPARIPELPIQYADFAQWQNDCLESGGFEEALSFWARKMAAGYQPLESLADHGGPRGGGAPAAREPFFLSGELTARLARLGGEHQATMFTVLLAAMNALLFRYTGQPDLIVCASLAARSKPELRNLIGLIANVLPFRTDVSGDPPFHQLLKRTRETVAGAIAYQELPFARILEMLRTAGADASPMQAMLIFHNQPLPELALPGVSLTPCEAADNGVAKFDLLLDVEHTRAGLCGWLKYDSLRFDPATARGFVQDLAGVLDCAVEDPQRSLSALPVQGPGQARRPGRKLPAGPGRPVAGPRDEVEQQLLRIWGELLGKRPCGIHDDFFDLGGHSLLVVRLAARIEKEMKIQVPLRVLFESRTVASLAARIRARNWDRETSMVSFGEGAGAGIPFYCVHPLGGEVMSFRHLAKALGGRYRFYGIQMPLAKRSPAFASSIEGIAAHHVAELVAFQPEGPFVLGGWSAGSTIALEMAQQLRASGREVALLVALDGAPFKTGAGTPRWSPVYVWKLVRNVPLWVLDDLLASSSVRKLVRRALSKAAAIGARALTRVRHRDGNPVSSFIDVRDYSESEVRFMNSLLGALRRYRPKPYAGPVVLYQARTEPLTHLFEVDRTWRKLAPHASVVRVPGSHLTLIDEPNVQVIAADLEIR